VCGDLPHPFFNVFLQLLSPNSFFKPFFPRKPDLGAGLSIIQWKLLEALSSFSVGQYKLVLFSPCACLSSLFAEQIVR